MKTTAFHIKTKLRLQLIAICTFALCGLSSFAQIKIQVQFETADEKLVASEEERVLELIKPFASYKHLLRFGLVGHTDNVGRKTYNDSLSFNRAAAVREILLRNSIAGKNIVYDGRGFSEPIAKNWNQAGRALNRRVMITISSWDDYLYSSMRDKVPKMITTFSN